MFRTLCFLTPAVPDPKPNPNPKHLHPSRTLLGLVPPSSAPAPMVKPDDDAQPLMYSAPLWARCL